MPYTIDMSDSIEFEGKSYISSKQAASETGYAKDYVGQLCRAGKVDARLIGRSWYVTLESLLTHRNEVEGAQDETQNIRGDDEYEVPVKVMQPTGESDDDDKRKADEEHSLPMQTMRKISVVSETSIESNEENNVVKRQDPEPRQKGIKSRQSYVPSGIRGSDALPRKSRLDEINVVSPAPRNRTENGADSQRQSGESTVHLQDSQAPESLDRMKTRSHSPRLRRSRQNALLGELDVKYERGSPVYYADDAPLYVEPRRSTSSSRTTLTSAPQVPENAVSSEPPSQLARQEQRVIDRAIRGITPYAILIGGLLIALAVATALLFMEQSRVISHAPGRIEAIDTPESSRTDVANPFHQVANSLLFWR